MGKNVLRGNLYLRNSSKSAPLFFVFDISKRNTRRASNRLRQELKKNNNNSLCKEYPDL